MNAIRFRLSAMMFLQFFIWGAWYELGFDYIPSLGFTSFQNWLVFGAFNFGALVALFFSTQFADRKFAAERFMALSHLIGGVAILGLFFIRREGGEPAPFWPFFLLMIVHCMFYVPTISISNSVAFANLRDAARDFGPIRVWGTIGWIVASWPFIFILVDWARVPESAGLIEWLGNALRTPKRGVDALTAQRYIFLVAGIASLVLAGFSLTLPHTPPRPAADGESLAWLKAARLLKHPFVAVLFAVTFIDAAVHQSYFYWTAPFLRNEVHIDENWIPAVMKISQLAEILTMLALGYVLKNLGWRTTMVFGVLGHAARFAVFAFWPEPAPAILINVVHGVCYAFFFATVYIFVDEFFPKDVRSSAQGLFNALILGLGPLAANYICGQLKTAYTVGENLNYTAVFQYSMGAAVVGAVLLAVLFHPQKPVEPLPFSEIERDAPPAP
jgi:nucleoside transporter